MPMIRSSYGNGVHIRVVQDAAEVFNTLRFSLLLFRDGGDAFFNRAAIHIANVGDLSIRLREVTADVSHAAAVAADDSNEDFFVRAFGRAQRTRAAEGREAGG